MGDSEDEFDRQRREKFRRERSDAYDRRPERDWGHDNRNRGWSGGGPVPDRESVRPPHGMMGDQVQRHRPEYGGQPPQDMKRRFSPGRRDDDMGPRKRMRGFEPGGGADWRGGPGWEPRRPGFRPPDEWGPRGGGFMGMDKLGGRMLTFKQWLSSQPDDIGDEEAITKYTEYKISFKRQQLQEFFIAHKEEEWFKEKYHPDESGKRKQGMEKDVRWRAETFQNLVEKGFFEKASLDLSNEEQIIRLLDTAVIMLEGGTEEDLKVLNGVEANEAKSQDGTQQLQSDENEKLDEGEIKDDDNPEESMTESKKQAELFKQLVDDKKNPTDDDKLSGKAVDTKENSGSSDSSDSDSEKDKTTKSEPEKVSEEVPAKPKLLHQTYSIFMRSLPPTVTRNDIINLCKKFPGFMRVAFSQPLEDHSRFIRRCWVTFQRSVNIKDICWNLNNIRLRNLELNPVVNRDLARRVRPISGIALHKTCARNDLKNVTRLIMHLDGKTKLWLTNVDSAGDADAEGKSKNPWLANISEFLVDESSAEESELLGPEVGMEVQEKKEEMAATRFISIQRDEKLIKQLDVLLYYLRLVHSVDYYNASQYPNEDEMPNRCGIVHARGPVPPNKLTLEDVAEFQKRFDEKLAPLLEFKEDLTKEQVMKLGLKNEEDEVEKFVSSNTQELGKDKWLCPLSGKKFKGPDYVRKHIFNKHADKVEAVKNEVAYYNNYLHDPCRPGPAEFQRTPVNAPGPGGPPPPVFAPYGGRPMGDPGFGQFSTPQYSRRMPPPMPYAGGKTYPPKQREPRGREPYSGRPVVEYRDLDAPEDTDFF